MMNWYRKLTIIFTLFSLITVLGCTKPPRSDQKIHIVFRYDDYCATSDPAFTDKLLDLFQDYDAPVTFGVIPYTEPNNRWHDPLIYEEEIIPLTDQNAEFLRNGIAEGTLEIAMHGYSHQNNNSQKASEFTGLDYDLQLRKLTEGKTFLDKTVNSPVNIFVPPWNAYDLNTLLALNDLGFSIISARPSGIRDDQVKLSYLPFSCTLVEIEDGIKKVRETDNKDILLVVLFHEYEFTDFSHLDSFISYNEFSRMMKWLSKQKDIEFITLEEAVKYQHNLVYCD